nr:transposase [Xanthomonas oryzae]
MKKRFSEEQIIGFLREAEAGMPIKDLCRRRPPILSSSRV